MNLKKLVKTRDAALFEHERLQLFAMNVSTFIASEESKQQSLSVKKDIPLDIDSGLLTVTDLNPLDYTAYGRGTENYLQSVARDGCQGLITSLFSLQVESTPDGPLAKLPDSKTHLPRSKPLPKSKPPTKWERFAAAKGIQKTKSDRKVFDEEKQEWVNKWGRGGKNRELETQWLTEIPSSADADHDPIKASREERKKRIAKNESQRQRNLEYTFKTQTGDRKRDIEKTLAVSKLSTASMGKFDKHLEGDKKIRGVKRKFEPNEVSAEHERKSALAIASNIDISSKRSQSGGNSVLNVRKAIRTWSKTKGSPALAGHSKAGKATEKNRGRR